MAQEKRGVSFQNIDRRMVVAILVIAAVVLFISGSSARAQSGVGSIQGTVKDSTGAVIPQASIKVVNAATGVRITTKTNGVGFYDVPGLFTGKYTVTVTAPEMKSYITSIQLLVAQAATINPILIPGKVTERIVVNANQVQLLNVRNGTITNTLENQRINQLPMNGRDIVSLVGATTPGLEDGGQKMNGQAVEAMGYVVDGVSTANNNFGGQESQLNTSTNAQVIDPDSVQEVQVLANGADARYETPATAILTTKSGTNKFHGTFFETARNNAIGIAKSRQDPPNFSAPHLVRNEFGASLGGPIVLPHYNGRDKSFFFFAYERYSLATDTAILSSVPTDAMRNGDFSGLVNAAGILQVQYDPATTGPNAHCPVPNSTTTVNNPYCRTPFPNNQIPQSEMSPLQKVYNELVPEPTNTKNPLVESNLTSLNPSYTVQPQYTFRLDHTFNERNRAYLRFTNNWANINSSGGPRNRAVQDGNLNIPVGAAFGYMNLPTTTFLAALGYTHIFSPTFSSQTVLSQQWLRDAQEPGIAPNVDYESMLGLPNNFGEVGFPSITGMTKALGTSQTNTARASQTNLGFNEDLTKIWGRHQIAFGVRYGHNQNGNWPNFTADVDNFGSFGTALYSPSSGKNYTAYPQTGHADGSFFLGEAGGYTVNLEPPHVHYHLNEFDAYAQDEYHVDTDLSLQYGLRYEAHPAIAIGDGLSNTFDLKNDAMVLASPPAQLIAKGYTTQAIITNEELIGVKFETPEEAGVPPGSLMKNYYFNFYPRLGVAWQPFGDRVGTVVRGSYGRYSYPTSLEDYVNRPEVNDPLSVTYAHSYSAANQSIDGLPNELLRYNDPVEFGVAGKNSADVVDSSSTTAILPGVSLFSVDPNWRPAVVTEANFTIGQRLPDRSVVRASYVWTHADNLDVEQHYNAPLSNYQYEMAYGVVPPTGGAAVIGTSLQDTYAATAKGPYDKTTWGNSTYHMRAGWSNYNALQINYQRLFHRGYAYQASFVWAKAMRMGGNAPDVLSNISPYADYPGANGILGKMTSPYGQVGPKGMPPAPPEGTPIWANYHALDDYELYQVDPDQPTMHVKFNGIVDLPVGRGKWVLGHAGRLLNELVGGYQLASIGNIYRTPVSANLGDWGPVHPLKIYKHSKPITDCRSGVCEKAYLWYNGYLPPTVTTYCEKDCVDGVPTNYEPDETPIDNTPGTEYYGQDEVAVTLSNGKTVDLAYDGGPEGSNYLNKAMVPSPVHWTVDASLFKVFPIKRDLSLRINVDAFNVFNVQGDTNPGTDGVVQRLSSFNTPRQIQLTARLTF